MNELNKQLNELLGIKPKYGYVNRTELVDSKIDEYMKEVYPNLFLPENFVKLLECYVKSAERQGYLCTDVTLVGVNLIERFITGLVNAEVDDEDLEEMKYQAQQVEWKR